MPLQQMLPTWVAINNANFASPSGMVDPITGFPYYSGGLSLGDYFDLTEAEANAASYTATGTLHSGRYRLVRIDPAAAPSLVIMGRIGSMAHSPDVNTITNSNQGLGMPVAAGQLPPRTVVFLNTITPGNYGFVQELGIATLLSSAVIALGAAVGADPVAGTIHAPAAGDAVIGQALNAVVGGQNTLVLLNLPVVQG